MKIAYVACCRVDNGETAVTRAGRVCPDHHGKHLYSRFKSEIETLQKADGITRRHALIKSAPPSERFLNSYKPVAKKDIYLFEYNRGNVSSKLKFLASDHSPSAKVIDTIPADFLSPPYSNYLFPEGRVILDWVPFRLLLANVPLFKGRNTVFYTDITTVETERKREINDEPTQLKTKHAIPHPVQGLLSASTVFKAHHDLDLSCNLDVFGTDFRSLRDHIIFHLQRIDAIGLEKINLRVYTMKGVDASPLLDPFLRSLGVETLTRESTINQYIEQVIYEKEING
ncbi:uncharacterized protein LOC123554430 isoform X2 [Mercenaria mercenaria]|uniref:uncharacterized protein LOC123554430 isoform X2 n=1 Tax=Mercenaria mercenaria TaxID=6596 RepID=UPI00234F2DCB|nr:uncharacterized protein LOC123554430 isoform X2 [Mercenaria mercenaria]